MSFVPLPRLLRTASFKLAALYAVTFAVSVVVLAAIVYVISTSAMHRQMRERIAAESRELAADYRAGGLEKLIAATRARDRSRLAGGLEYSVFAAPRGRIYGDLPHAPEAAGWSTVTGPPDGDEAPGSLEKLIVLFTPLDKGVWLAVGDDSGKVRAVGALIMTTFGWALLVMISFAAAGGIILSAAFLRRIDTITRTAETIIGGNMQNRMPLRGTGDDLDRLSATLNTMLDRIGGLMESINQVASDIAHDLRTPLGRMRQILDEARHNAQNTEAYALAVDRALAETDSILDTFAAMLRIAQIESGSRRAGFRAVDLAALTTSIAQTYTPVAEDAGCTLSVAAAPAPAFQGDRELLLQMLANLIENAIRHAGAGAAVAVTLSAEAGRIMLSVSDNGPGIPEPEREAVLRRFYRLERSRSTAGSGLGLSLVAAVVDLHGGSLELCDNHPGLAVKISLPAPAATNIATTRPAPTALPRASAAPSPV